MSNAGTKVFFTLVGCFAIILGSMLFGVTQGSTLAICTALVCGVGLVCSSYL